MNKPILLSVSTFCILLLAACVKDVGKPVQTTAPVVAVGFCDTIKYNKHIKPIIVANCMSGCHVNNGTGPGDFTIFDDLKAKVTSGAFKKRVIDAAPPGPMPASGQLPQAQLTLIKCWLDKGANND